MPITIDQVNAADTLNQGRTKWNANDETLKNAVNSLEAQQSAHVTQGHPTLYYTKSEVDATIATWTTEVSEIETALGTHKSSNDHDARYYTKSEVNQIETDIRNDMDIVGGTITAHKSSGDHDNRYIKQDQLPTIVRTTGDQTITGIKNMATVRVNWLDLKDPQTGNVEGSLFSFYEDHIKLTQKRQGNYVEVLRITKQGYVDFPFDDVRSKGKKLATEEYVNSVINQGGSNIYEIIYTDVATRNNNVIQYPVYISEGSPYKEILKGWFIKKPGMIGLKARMYIGGNGADLSDIIFLVRNYELYGGGSDGSQGRYVSEAGDQKYIEITLHPQVWAILPTGPHEWKILQQSIYERTISEVMVYSVI